MLTNKPKTRILVGGRDPEDTSRVKKLLGFVDGQTTNPTLIAKNPEIQRRIAQRTPVVTLVLALLTIALVWLGVYPAPMLRLIHLAIGHII